MHRPRRGEQQMPGVVERQLALGKPQICLMNEVGGRKRPARREPPDTALGQLAKLRVKSWEQISGIGMVATLSAWCLRVPGFCRRLPPEWVLASHSYGVKPIASLSEGSEDSVKKSGAPE